MSKCNQKYLVVDYFFELNDVTLLCISHDTEWLSHKNIKIFNLEKQQWEQ